MTAKPSEKDPMVKTSVTIRESQREWAQKNHINISGVLREALDKLMKKVKFA